MTLRGTPEYEAYHAQVVKACVELMGESARVFFRDVCDYVDEFACGEDPAEVALHQQESL